MKGLTPLVLAFILIYYLLLEGKSLSLKMKISLKTSNRGGRRVPQIRSSFTSSLRKRTLDPNVLRRDFKAVWQTGFFDDLKIEIEQGKPAKLSFLGRRNR
jgi:hypothetical protein